MNKKIFLLGLVTIGLLLLGSLPTSVGQDDQSSDPFGDMNGAIDLSYDISLTNSWFVGPSEGSVPSDLTNTNLRYSLTSMKSPLDAFFNVGAFMFGDVTSTDPMPEFMVNGTFEGSELFVKIVNDQLSSVDPNNRLLDWQAVLTLGSDIDISVLIPENATMEGFPIDLIPTTVSIPAGSGIPPLPVVRSTTNFSYFEDLSELASSFGYDGLPFVTPAMFYIESLAEANDYWTNVNLSEIFEPSDDPMDNQTLDLNHVLYSGGFNLSFDAVFHNTTTDFGNVSLFAHWNSSGWLENFEVSLFADLDQSSSLDAEEEFSIVFDLLDTAQAPLPISVGDVGEYILNMDFSATVDLDNDTEEEFANTILTEITASINELDGEVLLNYTVDAMDGLYYHIDGYMLDLPRFMQDRLGFLFGGEPVVGMGAQEPLPPIEDYYIPIGGMDVKGHDFALNLFDAQVYSNDTMFYETYDGHYYWDPYMGDTWQPMHSKDGNTTYIEMHMPGIVNAMVFELNSWNYNLSLDDNLADLESMENYNGPVEYVEINDTWSEEIWNGTHMVMEWYYNTYETIEILSNDSFLTDTDYIAVLEIEALPGTGFTSYMPMMSPYMMMFNDNGPDEGFGAQDVNPPEEMSLFGMATPDPQSMLPLPARTPDWEQVGGPMVFLEGYIVQIADVITSPEFISFLEEMAATDPGDLLTIHYFDMGLDWFVNGTHAGAENWVELNMTMVDNDTGNMEIVTQSAYVNSYESYLWHSNGIFDTATVSVQMSVDMSSEEWVIDTPDDTTTTTTPTTTGENDTTTTETALELTPGFEVVFTLGSLIAIPLFFKKRR